MSDNKELLITLMVPSRRIWQLEGLIESLKENTKDLSRIQLIVKCDDDQLDDYKKLFDKVRAEGKVDLRWVSSPRLLGVFTMWVNVQLMWKMVPKDSYFVFVLTDEGRFIVKDWDEEIAQYKGYYKDDIFRLRLSISRDVNYYTINQTIFMPDCFPVYTRRWVEITDGLGDCWGSDAYEESIAYHLGRGTGPWWLSYPQNPVFRDLVINKRLVGGIDEFAQDLKPDEQKARSLLTIAEWKRMVGRHAQLKHCEFARRLLLEIKAQEMQLNNYRIEKDSVFRSLVLYDEQGIKKLAVSYHVPFWFTIMAGIQFYLFEGVRITLPYLRSIQLKVAARVMAGKLYRMIPTPMREMLKKTLRQLLVVLGSFKTLLSKPAAVTPTLERVLNISGIVGVQHGALYKLEDNKLGPSNFMLDTLKKAHFVTCTADELTYWVEQAYADEPAKTASSDEGDLRKEAA